MDKKNVQKRLLTFQPLNREELLQFCSEESLKYLDGSMSALVKGHPTTPSFKLYGKSDVSVATNFLDSLTINSDCPKWMHDYESSRLKKWGPQGGHKPWSMLKDDFILYYERPQDCEIRDDVLQDMLRKYSRLHLLMYAANQTLAELISTDKIQDRAAGWSTFELKKTDPVAQRIALTLARNGVWKRGYGYVFSRFNKLKLRIFMPMPFSSMIVQAQYYLPFLQAIQTSLIRDGANSPFLFWADKVGLNNGMMLKILNERIQQVGIRDGYTPIFVQRDFEKMDTTTGSSQYRKVFIPALRSAFGFREGSEHDQALIDAMLFTTECPIITPDGIIPHSHGTASGAEVTNGGETVCNEGYDSEVLKETEEECRNRNVKFIVVYSVGNGDDGASLILVLKGQEKEFQDIYTNICDRVAKRHGYRVQAQKWHISPEYGIYCQYMLWLDGNNILHQGYPAVLALNAICNPEHEYTKSEWDKDYRDHEIIAKCDNCHGLPYFHKLVDYVDNGMKFRLLGRSEQETKRILSKYDKWRSLQDPSEYFNKRTFDPSTSPTVNYILSKR